MLFLIFFVLFFCFKLTENIESMFKIALMKYNAWKMKQGQTQ